MPLNDLPGCSSGSHPLVVAAGVARAVLLHAGGRAGCGDLAGLVDLTCLLEDVQGCCREDQVAVGAVGRGAEAEFFRERRTLLLQLTARQTEQPPRDDEQLDLLGPLEDVEDLGVPGPFLE